MSEVKKLTEEELQSIKELQTQYNKFVFELGSVEAQLQGLLAQKTLIEEENKVLEFGIDETADLYETIEDYDEKYEYREYNAFPQKEGPTNVYLSIDENKGGMFKFSLESDTVPTPTDFTYSSGSIGTPEGDYDFIGQVFFKGQPLEIEDCLDNSGKSSSCMIYTLDGETIE